VKFKENQEVVITYKKKIFMGFIRWFRKSDGIYFVDRIEQLPFSDLKRGSEAIFETEKEAQEYLEKITT
jgi:hypothetical protein